MSAPLMFLLLLPWLVWVLLLDLLLPFELNDMNC